MEQKKAEQSKKDHAAQGSCSSGAPQKTGSCGSDAKKMEKTGSCSSGEKSKKGSCGG